MKKTVLLIILLVLFALVLFVQTRTSTYAPPREATTVLPFVEPSNNYPVADNQSNVFIDAGGWINQREHPLAPFIQGDARRGEDVGDFVGLESSSGDAPMYVIAAEEQYEYDGPSLTETDEYIPSITSRVIPLLGETLTAGEQQASSTSR